MAAIIIIGTGTGDSRTSLAQAVRDAISTDSSSIADVTFTGDVTSANEGTVYRIQHYFRDILLPAKLKSSYKARYIEWELIATDWKCLARTMVQVKRKCFILVHFYRRILGWIDTRDVQKRSRRMFKVKFA